MRILCTGDLHIGRRPNWVPGGENAARHSAASGWQHVVERAVELRVDLVVLTGDVVDRDNKFVEAFGAFERGLAELQEAGIGVCAVAGNHDYDVLPRIERNAEASHFHLLGAGGQWSRFVLSKDDRPILYVDGWSFPFAEVYEDPWMSYDLAEPDEKDVPRLGLLHTALDGGGSHYAPVARAELAGSGHDAWVLGHVHAPEVMRPGGETVVVSAGSPQAMSFSEPGAHGVWLLELSGRGRVSTTFIPLSSLRYDAVGVDVNGATSVAEVETRCFEAVRAHVKSIQSKTHAPSCLICRLRLKGRTAAHRDLGAWSARIAREIQIPVGRTVASIEKVVIGTQPAIDVAALAASGRNDAACRLARVVSRLQDGSEAKVDGDLVERATEAVMDVDAAGGYAALRGGGRRERDRASKRARQLLVERGTALLDMLLAQREATEP